MIRWLLRRPLRAWFLAALVAGIGWRVLRYGLVFPVWGDEAFVAVNFFDRGFGDMLERLDNGQVVPLGFLWSVRALAGIFGRSELVLRFLAWSAGLAALLLFAPLAKKVLRPHAALAALAIFAASFYPVRHSAEVKPYTFDLLASILVIAAARSLMVSGTRARWWLLGAGIAVAVWCSYPIVFNCGGALLVLGIQALRTKRPRALIAPLLCGVVLLASFVAMYSSVGRHQQWKKERIEDFGHWAKQFPPIEKPWMLPIWLLDQHTGNMLAYPNGFKPNGSSLTTLLVVVGAVALWRTGRRSLVLLLLSPLPLMLIAAALKKYPYGGTARTNLHLAAPICLFAGQGLVALLRWRGSPKRVATGVRIATGLLILTILGQAIADVVGPYKSKSDRNRREAIRSLDRETSPEDQWIVFGDFRPNPEGPDLTASGGTAAVIRYYLELYARVPLFWAPAPETIDPNRPGRTFAVVYRDEDVPFPDDLWQKWRGGVAARLGEPSVRKIRTGNDEVEILTFDPHRR